MELAWSPALAPVTELQLYKLFHALWDLDFCQSCLVSNFAIRCDSGRCPTSTTGDRFRPYIGYYKRLCASYEPSALGDEVALQSHDDIRRVLGILRSHPDKTKGEIQKLAFPIIPHDPTDAENALNLTMSIFAMLNCGSQESSSILLEDGCNRIVWRQGTTLAQYIRLVLPKQEGLSPHRQTYGSFLDPSCPLATAKELKRQAGTRFRGTDDITNHLRYDPIANVLFIFHHATFLKEQLRLSSGCDRVSPKISGAIPRRYALEVLNSTQKILFPLWDSESVALLQSLVSNASFDKDILNANDAFIGDDEENIDFEYLWPRLSDIYHEIQDPRPRGWMANWLQRRSGARYVMLAAVMGVAFALVLGIASLAVSSYQTFLAYQAWQHPIDNAVSR
jgi:hypothetical protein